MDSAVTLYHAKTHLSSLVDRAAAGEEIIVTKHGRPRAKLVPVRSVARRQPGHGKGKITMSADFDAPLPKEILESFFGGVE
jgi:prevent-host-death family protein